MKAVVPLDVKLIVTFAKAGSDMMPICLKSLTVGRLSLFALNVTVKHALVAPSSLLAS